MKRNNLFTIICLIFVVLVLPSFGQTIKKKRKTPARRSHPAKAKGTGAAQVFIVEASPLTNYEREKFLGTEPCANETAEQTAELENAADVEKQVSILSERLNSKDSWIRGCAVKRLELFGGNASAAVPYLIKLYHDDETPGMYHLTTSAMFSIPPSKSFSLREWIQMSRDKNTYTRIYGIWGMTYYRQVAGTNELKDTVNALIEATKDEDVWVRWIAVNGIARQGIIAHDTVPALIELLQNKANMKLDTVVVALGKMNKFALPAAPILFDIMYNTKKYASERDAYVLRMFTAQALPHLGKELIPLLEKEFNKHPNPILQIAENMSEGDIAPIIIAGFKHPSKAVRLETLKMGITYNDHGATIFLPYLLKLGADPDSEIRKEAVGKIGELGQAKRNNSEELNNLLKTKAIPIFKQRLADKVPEVICYTAFAMGNFAIGADEVVPLLVRLNKKPVYPNSCAENALFSIGPKGQSKLAPEKLQKLKDDEKSANEYITKPLFEEPKKIVPKTKPAPEKIPDTE